MSDANGNGRTRTLDAVRDEYRRERLELRLAEARVQRQLIESWGGPFGAPDGYGGPWGHGPGGDGWLPIGQGGRIEDRRRGDNGPLIVSEEDLDRVRGQARILAQTNGVAIGILTNLRNFTIRTGFRVRATPEPEAPNPEEAADLARQVQVSIDEFRDINDMARREKIGFVRAVRDGERFTRYFVQDDGCTLVRAIEPEQIRRPADCQGPEWSWGIHTDPDDVETVLEYAAHPMDGGPPEIVPACEIDHVKRNVDETVKRGISDFFAVGESLDGVLKLVRNMRVGESVRAAITGFWKYEVATRQGVQSAIDAARDRVQPSTPDAVTGRAANYQQYAPGSILHVPKGREFVPPPASPAIGSQTGVVQACLRSIGVRWSMPEYLVSGDASNNAFASALVAGSPFVVAIETEQDDEKTASLSAHWRAVENYADAGRFRLGSRVVSYEEVMALVQIECSPPDVANVDRLQQTQIKEIELRNGITSKQQWRGEAGNDSDRVKKDLQEEPVDQQQPGAGPSGIGAALAAPPGSGSIGLGSADPVPTAGGGAASDTSANTLRATVGGSQAVAELQRAYYAGELPREAAIANARLVFGFSPTDAAQLFPETAPVKLTPDAKPPPGAQPGSFLPRLMGG